MAITATGIGSGVDVEGVVTKIIAAEGAARNKKIDKEQASAINKISAYATLTSVLTTFDDSLGALNNSTNVSNVFKARTATSTTNTAGTVFFQATADYTATPNNYTIAVANIACTQQSSTTAFASNATIVGTGDLNFTVNGNTNTVSINSTNNTVSGIAAAVNDASATTGVSASLITTDAGVVLVFSSIVTGTNGAFTVAVANDADLNNTDNLGLSQLASNNLTTNQPAVNASISINNLTVTSQTNQLQNVITGVNINLVAPTGGNSYILTVANDTNAVTTAINEFVSSYNTLIDNIANLSKYDPDLKFKRDREHLKEDRGDRDESEQKTDFQKETGVLIGDATLLNVQTILSRLVHTYTPNVSGIGALSNIGITTDEKTGHLLIDSTMLGEKLISNFNDINTLFSDATVGIATNLDAALSNIIDSEGILPSKTEGLTRTLVDLTEQRIDLNRYLDALQMRLLQQFSAMDKIVGKLKNISSFLDQQKDSFVEPMAFRK